MTEAIDKLDVIAFTAVRRNTLRGFATIRYGSLTINDCPVHQHPGGRCWVALPGRPLLDDQGQQRRGPDGKLAFMPMASWSSRQISDRFSEVIVEILRARFPDAVDQ